MKRNKKIANVFNKSKNLLVWRESKNYYWITDKFAMIRLYKKDYQEFKAKWMSYKGNIYYEDLEIGEKINIKEGEIQDNTPNFDQILEKFKNPVKIKKTCLQIKGKYNIYHTVNNTKIVAMDDKYDQLIKDYHKKYTSEKEKYTKTIVKNGQNEVIAVLMSIRYDYESRYTNKSKDYNLEKDINNIYITLQSNKFNNKEKSA